MSQVAAQNIIDFFNGSLARARVVNADEIGFGAA